MLISTVRRAQVFIFCLELGIFEIYTPIIDWCRLFLQSMPWSTQACKACHGRGNWNSGTGSTQTRVTGFLPPHDVPLVGSVGVLESHFQRLDHFFGWETNVLEAVPPVQWLWQLELGNPRARPDPAPQSWQWVRGSHGSVLLLSWNLPSKNYGEPREHWSISRTPFHFSMELPISATARPSDTPRLSTDYFVY